MLTIDTATPFSENFYLQVYSDGYDYDAYFNVEQTITVCGLETVKVASKSNYTLSGTKDLTGSADPYVYISFKEYANWFKFTAGGSSSDDCDVYDYALYEDDCVTPWNATDLIDLKTSNESISISLITGFIPQVLCMNASTRGQI